MQSHKHQKYPKRKFAFFEGAPKPANILKHIGLELHFMIQNSDYFYELQIYTSGCSLRWNILDIWSLCPHSLMGCL